MKLQRSLLILLLLLSVLFAVQLLTGSFAPRRGELGELYERYCEQPGVRVALVQNMPINDTLSKDILLLTATDSAGWAWIVKEIGGHDEGTRKFNYAMRDSATNYGMSVHAGTMREPGKLVTKRPIFDTVNPQINHEILRVTLLYKLRTAWITIPKTRAESRALLDLEFEDGKLI